MTTRIGINGFGRIGRAVLRVVSERPDLEITAINDLYDNAQLAYLLKYDTVMGIFPGEVESGADSLTVNGRRIRMTKEKDPARIPWESLGVEIVVESTGVFRTRESLQPHLAAGARRVILTVPPKDEIDAMIVMGVNEHTLRPEHRLVSNASCTTNCLAPIAKILDEAFGIEEGFMTTVHAYTNDQRLADVPHKDLRRSRAAATNIIPTTTGAARAVGKVLPQLRGRMGEAKSYAERLFDFPMIGALTDAEAELAIVKPAQNEGVQYAPEAVAAIISKTRGYPYFLQEWGKHAWDIARQSPITEADVQDASISAIAALDESFFRVRFDPAYP